DRAVGATWDLLVVCRARGRGLAVRVRPGPGNQGQEPGGDRPPDAGTEPIGAAMTGRLTMCPVGCAFGETNTTGARRASDGPRVSRVNRRLFPTPGRPPFRVAPEPKSPTMLLSAMIPADMSSYRNFKAAASGGKYPEAFSTLTATSVVQGLICCVRLAE